jgi:hypothetical protein
MTTVAGLFDRYEEADRAIRMLYNYGVTTNEINVVTRAETVQGRPEFLRPGPPSGFFPGPSETLKNSAHVPPPL